ncbi:MGH1-like glycoside hydrolase domain-containing protein [Petropleomorpha daqingensis]|uniref:Mannosylglycerate hydrolase MGH1-like glycoside hydrolase domain-containing protein n=1 Tax=Petropleomorpha daqingensis TaxID=2026353 RepID=A0A853CNJ0_9ACTN|nr:glucosidase [Petropleomorpha daqingensis]NYJ07553.1 hypothetical protein [Petropleomorpha daqingensis]
MADTGGSGAVLGAERERLRLADAGAQPWRRWGPYVAARAWGTVREDYSPDGESWWSLPHEQARSRAYRWSEDGMAAVCDDKQRLCLGLALWNGRDPILKERMFGLAGPEGNHGEDAKEYWWYLDSTPTHSWMRWRYHYPQAEFPYQRLVEENARRGKDVGEFELLHTGVFDSGCWQVTVDHAKAAPEDLLMRVTVRNLGERTETLHVLPTLWFRNTWDWEPGSPKPSLALGGGRITVAHEELGARALTWSGDPEPLFCENETNLRRLYGVDRGTAYPKDGIGDAVVHGAATVNPERRGTKAALWYRLEVAAGGTAEIRVRLAPEAGDVGERFATVLADRAREADEFYAPLVPENATADEARIMRQAFAGLLWSKQYYHYDVDRWLEGDPGQPAPPQSRRAGRNSTWKHVHASDVIVMPDDWEYPWFAAWDLAFHTIPLAHVDPSLAKQQLLLLTHEWYMDPRGRLPAYEYDFGDVNPPVHALAAMRVFAIDGGQDLAWLTAMFNKLLVNFTWWMNRVDVDGKDLFAGGFLGLDNIAPFDRNHPPDLGGGRLVEVDGTAWVALFELGLLAMAVTLAAEEPAYEDIAVKFFEHFWVIALAMADQGLWDEEDGLYYSAVHTPDGRSWPIRAHSVDGLLPLAAFAVPTEKLLEQLPALRERIEWFAERYGDRFDALAEFDRPGPTGRRLMSVFGRRRLERMLTRLLDESEFLSPHGIRAVSRYHADHPLDLGPDGRLDYEPGESRTGMFGGNSNWRGPVWFPMNYLIVNALARLDRYFGDDLTVEMPTGSGRRMRLVDVSRALADRLVGIWVERDGRRPVFGDDERLQSDPDWRDQLLFFEYFHGDTGAGLGASHQTGWTALVADLVTSRRFATFVAADRS